MRVAAYNANVAGYPVGHLELARVGAKLAVAGRVAKTAAMLCAAPFVGLVFVVALPFYGLGFAAWLAARALWKRYRGALTVARNVALFFAAPFVGLVYAVAFPLVGVGALAWMAVRAAAHRPAR